MRACALAVLIACSAFPQTVRIGVFGLFRPVELTVSSSSSLEIRAGGERRTVEAGSAVLCSHERSLVACRMGADTVRAREIEFEARDGRVAVAVPGKLKRCFSGVLAIRTSGDALIPVVAMDLETAVASAVAAETEPGTPAEALRAQAVVARSYYVALSARHAGFDFCDTTHCQFLREPPPAASAPAEAAEATRGLILTSNREPVAGLFTASCGGRTRAPFAQGGPHYPYFAVDCPYCRRGRPRHCSYCTRTGGPWPNRRGSGTGHGIGLCQNGASAMASEGAGFRAILDYYFPNTRIDPAGGY